MNLLPVRLRTFTALILGILHLLAADSAIAQTPEAFLVLEKADLFDGDGKVVGQAAEGDVLVLLMGGGDRGLIGGGGPPKARSIASRHVVFPSDPAGRALLKKLIAAGTKNPEHYRLHADNCWYAKDYEGMVADYSRVIELAPKDTRGYVSRAGAWMQLEKYDAALADLQEVSRIDPKRRPNTLNGFLNIYKAQKEWQRVVDIYTEKLNIEEQYGKSVEAQNLSGRGAAHEALEQWKQAKADYAAALRLNPRNREAAAGLQRMSEKK